MKTIKLVLKGFRMTIRGIPTVLGKLSKLLFILSGHLFFRLWLFIVYFILYPSPLSLGNSIYTLESSLKTIFPKYKRLFSIYKIRFTNIETSFFSNAGAIFAIIISIISILLSIDISFFSDLSKTKVIIIDINFLSKFRIDYITDKCFLHVLYIHYFTLFCFSVFFTYFLIAFFLRKILDHLSPEVYSKSSLINLNKSDLLTFIAYKNWYLLHELLNISYIKNVILENDPEQLNKVNTLIKDLEKYYKSQYKHIQQCIFLVTESTEKLGINKRELVNHILKFSPAIFEINLSKNINNLKLLNHLHEQNASDAQEILDNLYNYIDEIKVKHLKYLEQIIFHEDVHNYIIGLASTTSTSLSLKIFLRGISEIAKKNDDEFLYNSKFDTLLQRSKAHCGIDLMIQLKNYNLNDYNHLKSLENAFKNKLPNLRTDFHEYEKNAQNDIITKFKDKIISLINKNTYFIIFGSSELILKSLKKLNDDPKIKIPNLKIFVFQEDNVKSLDTRIFRYELSRSNKTSIASFTAKDHVISNLITHSDNVIFMAGIEIYCKEDQKLFHTNNYQSRVVALMQHLKDRYINKQIWLVGESYKIHDSVSTLDFDFFNNHYTTLDLYNLNDYFSKNEIVLISDK